MLISKAPNGGGGAATTDMDGRFDAELPKVSPRMLAVVAAPGFALSAFEVSAEGAPPVLNVSGPGGTIELALPGSQALERENLTVAWVQNGLYLPNSAMVRWALDQGVRIDQTETFRVPNVAPGEYRACLVPAQLAPDLPVFGLPSGLRCTSGTLAPGSTLALKLGTGT